MSYWEYYSGLTFPNGTIFDRLTQNGIGYKLYQDYTDDDASYYSADSTVEDASGAVPQAGALAGLSLEDFAQLSGLAGDLNGPYPYPYSFIEPHYGNTLGGTYTGGSSQHPMDAVYGGENLLAGVYDAIRSSPYWPTSLLVICYDEHGGFFDCVKPPTCVSPGDLEPSDPQWQQDNQYGFDFTQLGVRAPALLVSPLIPAGTVSKTVFDHSSLSKLLSQLWGTRTLTARDAAAASPLGLLSLPVPRTDRIVLPQPAPPAGTTNPLPDAARQARLAEPLPRSGNEIGTLMVLRKAELEMSDGSLAAREEVLARVRAIRTRADAQAYAGYVLGKLRAGRKADQKRALPKVAAEPAHSAQ